MNDTSNATPPESNETPDHYFDLYQTYEEALERSLKKAGFNTKFLDPHYSDSTQRTLLENITDIMISYTFNQVIARSRGEKSGDLEASCIDEIAYHLYEMFYNAPPKEIPEKFVAARHKPEDWKLGFIAPGIAAYNPIATEVVDAVNQWIEKTVPLSRNTTMADKYGKREQGNRGQG